MNDRYKICFDRLQAAHEGAFVPFVTLGDPNANDSRQIIRQLIASGADALELGIPFSDPLADGPTIQRSMARGLAAGITPDDCFQTIAKIRAEFPAIPIGLLIYANLVAAMSTDRFFRRCRDAGVDSVLIADVPVCEVESFRPAALEHGVHNVLICPPNCDEKTLREIAAKGGGYTYLLSRAGVTGAAVDAGRPVTTLLKKLAELNAPPPLLGFGINRPEQVADAIRTGASGVICGSAIIDRIEQSLSDIDAACRSLHPFVAEMKAATRQAK